MKKKFDIEQIFLAALGSNQRLKWYLQYDINVVNYLDSKFPKYMAVTDITVALIPKTKIREMIKDIDIERILKILEKERPDLYKTLHEHLNGITWLKKQIENFRKRFL